MIYKKKTALTIYKAHSHPLQQENNTTTQQKISLRHYVPFRFNNNTNNNNNNKNNRHMYQHKYQQVIFPSHLGWWVRRALICDWLNDFLIDWSINILIDLSINLLIRSNS